jgi:hypothetical protein
VRGVVLGFWFALLCVTLRSGRSRVRSSRGGRARNRGAISLWSGESESLALASARRISGGEQCSPNSRKSPASRGFDPRRLERRRKKTVHRTVFLEYWWRRRLPNSASKPAWMLVLTQLRVVSYPHYYPRLSSACVLSFRLQKSHVRPYQPCARSRACKPRWGSVKFDQQ